MDRIRAYPGLIRGQKVRGDSRGGAEGAGLSDHRRQCDEGGGGLGGELQELGVMRAQQKLKVGGGRVAEVDAYDFGRSAKQETQVMKIVVLETMV